MDKQMVQELVDGFLEIINEKLVSVILYGSVARGTASRESDVDVALLIRGSLDADVEDKLSDFIVDMNLKHDKVFSVIDIDIDNYEIKVQGSSDEYNFNVGTKAKSVFADNVVINLNYNDLEKLDVEYILSKTDINENGFDKEFEEIYDEDGMYIFKVK